MDDDPELELDAEAEEDGDTVKLDVSDCKRLEDLVVLGDFEVICVLELDFDCDVTCVRVPVLDADLPWLKLDVYDFVELLVELIRDGLALTDNERNIVPVRVTACDSVVEPLDDAVTI